MISLLAALAFAATPSPATNIPSPPSSPPAQVTSLRELKLAFELSATGEATRFMCYRDVPPNICAALLPVVAAWKFRPASRDGQPFAAAHTLGVSLSAIPQADSYRLRIDGTEVRLASGAMFTRAIPPPYPSAADQRGKGASVTTRVLRGPAPKHEVKIEEVWVNGELSGPGDPFQKSTVAAIRSWKLRRDAGPPVFRDACIMVTYNPGVTPMVFPDLSPCKEVLMPGVSAGELQASAKGVFIN